MHYKKLLYFLYLCINVCISKAEGQHYATFSGPRYPEYVKQYQVPSIAQTLKDALRCKTMYSNTTHHPQYTDSYDFNPTQPAPPLSFSERLHIISDGMFDEDDTFFLFIPFIAVAHKIKEGGQYVSNCFSSKKHPKCLRETLSLNSKKEKSVTSKEYQDELRHYIHDINMHTYQRPRERAVKRLATIEEFGDYLAEKQEYYPVDNEMSAYMENHALHVQSYTSFNGTLVQQQLHSEIVSILTTNCALEKAFKECHVQPLYGDLIVEGIDLAYQCNKQNDTKKGFLIADYCGWLTEAEYPYLASVIKQSAGCIIGAGEGTVNTIAHTLIGAKNLLFHPLEATKDFGYCVFYAARFLTRATGEVGPLALHCMLKKTYEGYRLQPEFQESINQLFNTYKTQFRSIEDLPDEERARELMAFFTEVFLSGKAMQLVGRTASMGLSSAQSNVLKIADRFELYKYKALSQTYQRASSAIINGKTYLQRRKESLSQYLKGEQYVYTAHNGERYIIDAQWTSLVEEVAGESNELVLYNNSTKLQNIHSKKEFLSAPSPSLKMMPENKIPSKPSTIVPSALGTSQSIKNYLTYREELPLLKLQYDNTRRGWGLLKNKFLKLKFDHLFEIDKTSISQVKGLHHDLGGYLEENGIIVLTNNRFGQFGEYIADVIWNENITRSKTFFPKHWTRQQVIESIYEAYDNFLALGLDPKLERSGKYCIEGKSNIGMNLKIYIDQKANLLTAYPIKF